MSGTSTSPGAVPAVGDRIRLEVASIASGGAAFGRIALAGDELSSAGLAVFADRGIPGDVVEGAVSVSKARHVRVEVDVIPTRSEHEEPSGCAVSDACGGCRFWRASYTHELAWKSAAAEEAVRRVGGGVEWPAATVLPADEPRGYRGRARMRLDEDGRLGFYQARSNDAVAAAECPVLHPALGAVRHRAAALVAGVVGVDSVFLELDAVRHGVAVTVEIGRRDAPDVFRTIRARVRRMRPLDDITTIVVASGRRTTAVVGDGCVHRARRLGDRQVVVKDPVRAFSQANVHMNDVLVSMAVEACGVPEDAADSAALELFAGSGNLTFGLLGAGWAVESVEVARSAVDAAAVAARSLGGPQPAVRFHVGDLQRGIPDVLDGRADQIGVVVTDPPRGGMSRALTDAIVSLPRARRLVYVSCDPPAMARDVGRLAGGGWRPSSLVLLDMFPRTPHIEAVATLVRDG